jgi:ABC-type transporter Mla subunit MlaD
MRITPALKVGFLTLIALFILTMSLMWLKGRALSSGERIEVVFKDVDGMRPGSAVQMMGIRVGQIEEVIPVVSMESSYVKVRFVITEPNISIPKASKISIQQSGIIGEKFLELTPPKIQTVFLPVNRRTKNEIKEGEVVKFLFKDKFIAIGDIKMVEVVDKQTLSKFLQDDISTDYAYKVGYIVTKPGVIVPDGSSAKLSFDENHKNPEIKLIPPAKIIVQIPSSTEKYTIIEPMRFKEFLDLQLESVLALKETNDRINVLLSEESIDDLKKTLKNTKELTASANETLKQANMLISTTRNDFTSLMLLANKLGDNVNVLSKNVNDIVGNDQFKNNLISTTESIRKSTQELTNLIEKSELKDTLKYMNTTVKDASEVSSYFNNYFKDVNVTKKMDKTVDNLNSSLENLSKTLEQVNGLSTSEDKNLKQIIRNSSETTKNLKQFSEKLNKRFLLFRLMF